MDLDGLPPHHDVVLSAARALFRTNLAAPMSQIAGRAQMGMSAVYARYGSREVLVEAVWYADAWDLAEAAVEASLAREPRRAIELFLTWATEADVHVRLEQLRRRHEPAPVVRRQLDRAEQEMTTVIAQARRLRAVRDDLAYDDLRLVLTACGSVGAADPDATRVRRDRLLQLLVGAVLAVPEERADAA